MCGKTYVATCLLRTNYRICPLCKTINGPKQKSKRENFVRKRLKDPQMPTSYMHTAVYSETGILRKKKKTKEIHITFANRQIQAKNRFVKSQFFVEYSWVRFALPLYCASDRSFTNCTRLAYKFAMHPILCRL